MERVLSLSIAIIGCSARILALENSPPVVPLSGVGAVEWVSSLRNDGGEIALTGEVVFRHRDGPHGRTKHGFRVEDDGTVDLRRYYGLEFEILLDDERPLELGVSLLTPDQTSTGDGVHAVAALRGAGWHTVTLPWSAFSFEQARTSFLKWIKEVRIAAHGDARTLVLRNVRILRGAVVALDSAVRGKSGGPGALVEYPFTLSNCTDAPQAVVLVVDRHGWEAMTAEVSATEFELAPRETKSAVLRVRVAEKVAPGGHETQVLRAIANGEAAHASILEFITAAAVAHPNILHTATRWQEVRDKVKTVAWARESQAELLQQADAWPVPDIASPPRNDPGDTYGPCVFTGSVYPIETGLMTCGEAWQLTRDKKYAEKVALFLRRLSDPERGYPVTWRGCSQSLVQEGHFFQHIAMAYDMALDSGVFTDADRAQIERTLRVFIETIDLEASKGAINNWNLSEVTGAFYCALAMQDLVMAERFFSGPSGIKDQLAKGTMDDGWWYECSISYNVWCASEFTQAALAYEPWGVNFRDMRVPANFSRNVMLSVELSGGTMVAKDDEYGKRRPFGMSPEIWGPNHRPYREIRDLWNSLLPFLDWRGVMFGVNDSTENSVTGNRNEVGGQPFEIAYYAFRDPAYAAIVKLSKKRDLLYGVPELPAQTPERFRDSACADNVGLAMLRSQTPDRPIREQIQAALHYGTHGWAHGHFDRTALNTLMRYGRSFYSPESVFYVYEPYMYKFYCQTSVQHNMVVVDQKMQEANESDRLLFYAGRAMQATVVQTESRWSNPPYGGMVYDYVPVKTFAEKQWREGRSVPNPADAPRYGSLTGFTEKILQRRLMVVADDYVVLADYVKGAQPHTFESLLQIKGFLGLEAPAKKFLRHDAQWNTDPLGSAQFVTDCDWFEVQAPARSRFEQRWGEAFGADNAGTRTPFSEDGVLKLDVLTLWPKTQQIMIGTAPEPHDEQKRLFYSVRGDGKVLADGKFGAWILGSADIDVSIDGVKQLELETRTELSRKPTLFWANARVVTRDGSEVPLSKFPLTNENVVVPAQSGRDYFGGPIKIVGTAYENATPAQPQKENAPAIVHVDLTGTNAVRFKATLGGDYPLGNEARRRKTYAVRAPAGDAARFLTVIEPYEDKSVVKSAVALDADRLRVEFEDGRVQEISIANFEGDGSSIVVSLREERGGVLVRSESTIDQK